MTPIKDNLQLKNRDGLSREVFEAIVEEFPDIIHSVDPDGNLVSVNKMAVKLLGYSKDELLGKSIFEIYADEVLEEVKNGFKDLKDRGFIGRVESKLKAKDGSTIDVEMRSISLYDSKGNFSQTFTIIRDIRNLNSMKQQMIQQSKLAAIGELASSIMHDIRNPLTVIESANSHMLNKAIENENWDLVKRCKANIERASGKISRLSQHLRDFSRLDKEAKVLTPAKDLIENCIFMVQNRLNESSSVLKNNITDAEAFVYGRENQLEQVFINLLSNASDAVKGRKIREISVSLEEDDDQTLILISDTGEGIPEKNLESIFESFFTTKPKGVGTGLGLSICKAIVDDHEGRLMVNSVPEEGTTFTVKLPRKKNSS